MFILKTTHKWLEEAAALEEGHDISAGRELSTQSEPSLPFGKARRALLEYERLRATDYATDLSKAYAADLAQSEATQLHLQLGVAKRLVEAGFSLEANYKYSELAARASSVDFLANAQLIGGGKSHWRTRLTFVIQCKAQGAFRKWLFVPEFGRSKPSGNSPSILWALQPYSRWKVLKRCAFTQRLNTAVKGVEMDSPYSVLKESDLEDDTSKLRYAIARCLHEELHDYSWHRMEAGPIISAGLLVTDAPIHLLRPDIAADDLSSFRHLNDIAEEVPYLSFHSGYGPAFRDYILAMAANVVRHEERPLRGAVFNEIERSALLRSLRPQSHSGIRRLFTQFVVCNHKRVGEFVSALKESVAGCSSKSP